MIMMFMNNLIEDQHENVPHHSGRRYLVYDIHDMQSDVICIDLHSAVHLVGWTGC